MNLKERLANSVGTAQARILSVQTRSVSQDSDEDTLAKINRHALRPLSLSEVFIFTFELSNSNVDGYFTRMADDSLYNFEQRINTAGVPLLGNHNSTTWPIGRIFDSAVDRGDGVRRLICDSYIVRDDQNEDISGAAIIRKVETGVQKDTSIGFIPGRYRCSICEKDMVPGFFSRVANDECDHYPGATYDGKVCYAWVEDGIILEGSLVYTGACPEAIIHKAKNAAELGKLKGGMLHSVCNALHIKLPTPNHTPTMQAKELLTRVANSGKVSDTLKRSLEEKAATLGDEPEENGAQIIAEAVAAIEQENTTLKEENASLKPKAADGETYRTALIEETLSEGVRALSTDFNRDEMEKHFRSASLDHIKAMRTQYKALTEKLGNSVNLTDSQKTELEKADNGSKPAGRITAAAHK